MLWKINILLRTYMNCPSAEKVQSWPESLTCPWQGSFQIVFPHSGLFSAILTKLLFYFESCQALFLSLPCYMSDRSGIHQGTWITLVHWKDPISDRAAWKCAQLSLRTPTIQVNCLRTLIATPPVAPITSPWWWGQNTGVLTPYMDNKSPRFHRTRHHFKM